MTSNLSCVRRLRHFIFSHFATDSRAQCQTNSFFSIPHETHCRNFKMSENIIYGPYHGKVLCVTVKVRPGQRFQTVDDGAARSLLSLGESQDLVFHLHQVTPHLHQHLWQLGQVKSLTVKRRVITQTHTHNRSKVWGHWLIATLISFRTSFMKQWSCDYYEYTEISQDVLNKCGNV